MISIHSIDILDRKEVASELLVKGHADINAVDANNRTALFLAEKEGKVATQILRMYYTRSLQPQANELLVAQWIIDSGSFTIR